MALAAFYSKVGKNTEYKDAGDYKQESRLLLLGTAYGKWEAILDQDALTSNESIESVCLHTLLNNNVNADKNFGYFFKTLILIIDHIETSSNKINSDSFLWAWFTTRLGSQTVAIWVDQFLNIWPLIPMIFGLITIICQRRFYIFQNNKNP